MKQIANETGISLASIKGRRQNTEWLWQIAHDISSGQRAEWRWLADEVIERFKQCPKWEGKKKPKQKRVDLVTYKKDQTARLAELAREFGAVGSSEPSKAKPIKTQPLKTKAASKGSG